MTGDPDKLSNLLSIMILIIINGRLFFMCLFFSFGLFNWSQKILNLEKNNKTNKKPP